MAAAASPQWPGLEQSISFVSKINKHFLNEGAIDGKTNVVMFSQGTIIVVSDDDGEFDSFNGYGAAYTRVLEDAINSKFVVEEIVQNNQKVFEEQRAYYANTPFATIAERAYSTLINAGYPIPGGELSDRIIAPIKLPSGESCKWIRWHNLDVDGVYSTTATNDEMIAVASAGDSRRRDFIWPEIAAIITADGTIHRYR
jgi:hypothetical protein